MSIKKVEYIKDYEVKVICADGKEHVINLESSIKQFVKKYNKFHEILDVEYFKNFKLNKEWNTLEWGNGFDICPDMLLSEFSIVK
jgi:Protein of unknown function (DUF2442)